MVLKNNRAYARASLDEEVKCLFKNERFTADGVDISGGGIKVRCESIPASISEDSVMKVKFQLPIQSKVYRITASLKVLRTEEEHNWVNIAGKFIDLSMADQDKIMQYVFQKAVTRRRSSL